MVADTGTGIPPNLIDSIFQPYFTTKSTGKGTGMGLAVVQGIVEKSKGKITVDSELEKGTTFRIFLPTTQTRPIDLQNVKKVFPTGTERILFLDDETSIVQIGKRSQEGLGYHVQGCTNSIKALELFRKNPQKFDLIITDMTMPKMTGDEFAKKAMKIRKNIPVILITGYSNKISSESTQHRY